MGGRWHLQWRCLDAEKLLTMAVHPLSMLSCVVVRVARRLKRPFAAATMVLAPGALVRSAH